MAGRVGRVTRVEEAMTGSAGGDVQVNVDIMDARYAPAVAQNAHEDALGGVSATQSSCVYLSGQSWQQT